MGEEAPFGNYVLEEKLATGGMAEVFRARRVGVAGFARQVCIKRILPLLSDEREFVEMFIDEARTGAQLRHGNIVSIDDFGEVGGQYYLCMEYVPGIDLSRLTTALAKEGRLLPFDVAAYIVSEVLKALDYAHRKLGADGHPLDVVHRDVSPHNVLLAFSGEVKLTDFGIARAASRLHHTVGDVVKGKLAYMAPEQARGSRLDGRADLFALGVVFFELLTGQRPFGGASENEMVIALLRGERPTVKSLRADVPPALTRVVDRLLEVHLSLRYEQAGDALVNLAEFPASASAAQRLAAIVGHYATDHPAPSRSDFDEATLPRAHSFDPRTTAPTAWAPSPGTEATRVDASPAGAMHAPSSGATEISPPPAAASERTATERIPRSAPSDQVTRTMVAPGDPSQSLPAREISPTDRTRTMVARGQSTDVSARTTAHTRRTRILTIVAVVLMVLSAVALVRVLFAG